MISKRIPSVLFLVLLSVSASGCGFVCEYKSRATMQTCNTDCGDGLFSSLCKSVCTLENAERLKQCAP